MSNKDVLGDLPTFDLQSHDIISSAAQTATLHTTEQRPLSMYSAYYTATSSTTSTSISSSLPSSTSSSTTSSTQEHPSGNGTDSDVEYQPGGKQSTAKTSSSPTSDHASKQYTPAEYQSLLNAVWDIKPYRGEGTKKQGVRWKLVCKIMNDYYHVNDRYNSRTVQKKFKEYIENFRAQEQLRDRSSGIDHDDDPLYDLTNLTVTDMKDSAPISDKPAVARQLQQAFVSTTLHAINLPPSSSSSSASSGSSSPTSQILSSESPINPQQPQQKRRKTDKSITIKDLYTLGQEQLQQSRDTAADQKTHNEKMCNEYKRSNDLFQSFLEKQ
jgi:hypothetical protein